jgi:2-oxoglutarate/2-oxoacid ferredoxin oxidoreductase subunit alpha
MKKQTKVVPLDEVVVKFAGDSGDGMQLTGSQFSDSSAIVGNDLATFPDFPSEIRAPQGTIAGVSGFQVHIGHKQVHTSGDLADVLVAMNPAALMANMKWVRPGATIIIDIDNFDNKSYKKAGYTQDPLGDGTVEGYNVVKAPITALTRATLADMDLNIKIVDKTKNQFALGILYWLFNRDITIADGFLEEKFKDKPKMIEANKKVIRAGYHFAETIEALQTTYYIAPVSGKVGKYRNITGNQAVAWGLMAAAEKSGRELFLGSYPITPASEILQELSYRKHMGVKTFQAEDEIAGICTAIGAAYAGALAATNTSGPGLALKGEAIGLAVMTELPLVIVNVQRGGPATGLPTKPEQSDLMQALYGRNGESPVVVLAASSPANCFKYAYEAAKIALERMVPVILLTDGYLANGSELWPIPKMADLPEIKPRLAKPNDPEYQPFKRDPETLAREWAIPGMEGLRHRVGGLEKADMTGEVSHNAINHQKMSEYREAKVQRVVDMVPDLNVMGKPDADLLVVGWGGTHGAILSAVQDLQEKGESISMVHFNYIKPLPKNTADVFKNFKKIVVCENNLGQFANYLRANHPKFDYLQFNKIQGLPFMVFELKEKFIEILKEK